jgi:hypothetical protein
MSAMGRTLLPGEPIADRLFEWIDAHRSAVRAGEG